MPQNTPNISPWRASYGVSFVRILEKIDSVISATHCNTTHNRLNRKIKSDSLSRQQSSTSMMTSSNGNIFRVTGPLFTGEFHAQRAVTGSFDVFFDLQLSWTDNREAGDLRRHRAHYDVIVMLNVLCTSLFQFCCSLVPVDFTHIGQSSLTGTGLITMQKHWTIWLNKPRESLEPEITLTKQNMAKRVHISWNILIPSCRYHTLHSKYFSCFVTILPYHSSYYFHKSRMIITNNLN